MVFFRLEHAFGQFIRGKIGVHHGLVLGLIGHFHLQTFIYFGEMQIAAADLATLSISLARLLKHLQLKTLL